MRGSRVRLEKHDSEQNMHRYYLMFVTQNLFGEWIFIREWGRTGTKGGRVLERVCSGLEDAKLLLAKTKLEKEKRGYVLVHSCCPSKQTLWKMGKNKSK